jgi:hypothetical protein
MTVPLFIVYLTVLLVIQTAWHQMAGRLIINELESMWKEAVVA